MGGRQGFTLAEVLIALTLLGIVAAFSIPKVMQYQADQQKRTVLLETESIIHQVFYQGFLKQELHHGEAYTYFKNKINYQKDCPLGFKLSNCVSNSYSSTGHFRNYAGTDASLPGLVLPNGAIIAFCGSGPSGCLRDDIFVDWNGEKPPNAINADQLVYITATYEQPPTAYLSPGQFRIPPDNTVGPPNAVYGYALYQSIHQ